MLRLRVVRWSVDWLVVYLGFWNWSGGFDLSLISCGVVWFRFRYKFSSAERGLHF